MKRRQSARRNVLFLGGDDIVELRFETEPGYIVSDDTQEAWEEDINQQFHDSKDNSVQVISDLQKRPLQIFKGKPTNTGPSTEVLASRSQDDELSFLTKKKLKNTALIWIGVIVGILTVTLSALALMKYNQGADEAALIYPVISAVMAVKREDDSPDDTKKTDTKFRSNSFTSILDRFRGNGHKTIIKEENIKDIVTTGEEETVQCIVFPEKTGGIEYPFLSTDLIPHDANQRKYKGKPTYLLGLDMEDKLWAVEPTDAGTEGESPKDCYQALECEREVDATYGLSEGVLNKIGIGLFILLAAAELVIIFIFAATATGGKIA